MQRKKEYTDTLKGTIYHTKLSGSEKRLAQLLTLILLEGERFTISDQPGCDGLKVIESKRNFGGFDLNYPRTVEVRFQNGSLKPNLGLSGTIYPASDIEVQFVRKVLDTFESVERAFMSDKELDKRDIEVALDVPGSKLKALPISPDKSAELVARVSEMTGQSVQYLVLRVSELI